MTTEHIHIEPADKLIAAHPLIFRGKTPAWCDLPAGWYDRADRLCSDIENALSEGELKRLKILQFKEKFASLRFYVSFDGKRDVHVDLLSHDGVIQAVLPAAGADEDGPLQRVHALVKQASKDCSTLCQTCSEPGKVVGTSWLMVLCEKHSQEND